MMTRQNYIAIAAGFFATNPGVFHIGSNGIERRKAQWGMDVRKIADVFAADNGRFDRGRFYAACGYDPTASTSATE